MILGAGGGEPITVTVHAERKIKSKKKGREELSIVS